MTTLNPVISNNSVSKKLDTKKAITSSISFQPISLLKKWQRCSLIANFFSQIQLDVLPETQKKRLENVLSSIANEILENTIRYSYDKQKPIKLSLTNNEKELQFEIENTYPRLEGNQLEKFLKKCKTKDTQSHMIDLLESSSRPENIRLAISLLSVGNTYNAKIDHTLKQNETNKNCCDITIRITLKIDEEID